MVGRSPPAQAHNRGGGQTGRGQGFGPLALAASRARDRSWLRPSRLAKALLEHETVERPEIDRLLAENDAGTEVPCADEVAA